MTKAKQQHKINAQHTSEDPEFFIQPLSSVQQSVEFQLTIRPTRMRYWYWMVPCVYL